MHHLLEIPDLVNEICLRCDKRSLATLGRTAKLFDCALNVLWSGYHNQALKIHFWHLVKCFPSEIITTSTPRELSCSAPHNPHHWERFNFYAKRVRNCHLYKSSREYSNLALLAWFAPHRPILPNLKALHINGGLEYAHIFLSPTLHHLTITCPDLAESTFASHVLPGLPSLCPDIVDLSLNIHDDSASHHVMTALLPQFHNLRKLELFRMSSEHLPLVTTLPNLTHLRLHDLRNSQVRLPSVWTGTCDALTEVQIGADSNTMLSFFRSLPKCTLESVSICIMDCPANEYKCSEIFHVLQEKCQTLSLHRVTVDGFTRNKAWASADHLVSFLRFPNITHFNFLVLKRRNLDDSVMSSIARSWPNLVHLNIRAGLRVSPKLTAYSLVLLAAHCPRLFHIGFEFDAKTTDLVTSVDVRKSHDEEPVTLAIQDVCNRSVHVLDVGYSPIGQAASVLAFLDSLFPNLRFFFSYIGTGVYDDEARRTYGDQWAAISHTIRQRNRFI